MIIFITNMRAMANRNRPFGNIIHKRTIKVPIHTNRPSQMEVEWSSVLPNAGRSSECRRSRPIELLCIVDGMAVGAGAASRK